MTIPSEGVHVVLRHMTKMAVHRSLGRPKGVARGGSTTRARGHGRSRAQTAAPRAVLQKDWPTGDTRRLRFDADTMRVKYGRVAPPPPITSSTTPRLTLISGDRFERGAFTCCFGFEQPALAPPPPLPSTPAARRHALQQSAFGEVRHVPPYPRADRTVGRAGACGVPFWMVGSAAPSLDRCEDPCPSP